MRHFLKLHGGAVVFYFLILVVMTFPLITVFSSAIPGFSSTDEPFGALWDSWRIRYSVIHGLSLKRTNMIAYPFGLDLFRWGVGLVIGTSFNHLLSVFTSPAFTWNAQVFLNFMLSAFLTYYLVYTLTRSRLSGVLSGLIFAFCPYQFARAWQHLGLTGNQWIVLMVFSCMLLRERPSRRSMGLFVLSCVLLCSFDYSVSYLGTIAGLTFVCYAACYGWREKRRRAGGFSKDAAYLRRVLLCAGLAGILLLPQFIPLVKNRLMLSASTEASAFNAFHRPFEDLFEQSARPLSYLLPSVHHPVFGGMTETFIGSRLYGTSLTEHTLYLGWTGLLLAAGAFLWWKRSRAGRNREVFYTGFFLLLACAAWSFSQPPWWEIGQLKILSPSFLRYKLL
ncbi:MAG: hypothetical protein MJA29_03365, partial [Candidatus Omnitrophica bacterium]|nr:hypothetical protein [Candidatus Omnitrophota bacterium]